MERSLMRMDLNLLKALYILLQERNVSRAADRLFVAFLGRRAAMAVTRKVSSNLS